MDYNNIQEQAKHYVRSFFDAHVDERILYHNRTHTEKVVEAAIAIGQHYQLDEKDFFTVNVAAWFHDIGYYKGGAAGHEEKGAEMAESFLTGTGVDATVIEAVRNCILATRLPQKPANLLEEIVGDADLFHLGTDEFGDRNKLLRKEIEILQHRKISKDQWRKDSIRFLESHHYHTDYCQLLLNEKQQENLDKMKAKEREVLPSDPVVALLHQHGEAQEEQENEASEKKVNLLFFGNFYKMSLPDYADGMLKMMDDRDFLYGSLIRDVYFQGLALGKKYRWLRLSYNVFMYGLILSVLAFLIAALAFPVPLNK